MIATERQLNLPNPQKTNVEFLRVRLRGGKGAKVVDERKDIDESSKSATSGLGLPAPEEDPEIAAEQEDESCRWGYLKRAEREMRIAEEKAEQREKEHQEYLEKRRKGEIEDPEEEVKDTLRWGDDGKGKKSKSKKGKAKVEVEPPPPMVAPRRRDDDEIVMAGRGGDKVVDDEASFDTGDYDESADMSEDDLKRIEEEERQFEIRRVEAWLTELKMGKYLELFLQEGWDTLDDILNMTQEDLLALGLKRGYVRRLLSAMGRDMSASLARASIARDVSYPRDHSHHPHRGYGHARASRARGDADIDIKPWSRESMPRASQARYEEEHQYEMERKHRAADRASGMHTSVRTSQGPGGSSRLAEAGGLGAFLMGVSPEEEDMENRHRQLQKQKEQIQERLERERRQHHEYQYGGGRRYR